MERCLFRSYLQILIDVWTCTNQIGPLLPQDRQVASLSRSLSQVSFLVHRQIYSTVSLPTLYIPDQFLPFSFLHTRRRHYSTVSPSPASPTRVTKFQAQRAVYSPSPNHNSFADGPYPVETSYLSPQIIDQRSPPSRRPQLWPFTHRRSTLVVEST